jgi:hypothetical protein
LARSPSRNAPIDLDLLSFRAAMDRYGGLQKSSRFVVQIVPTGILLIDDTKINSGILRDLIYLAEIAEMPGRGFMNMDVRYYGPNQKLPFQSTYEDQNFTFICRNGAWEREFFDDWMHIINPTNTFDFEYRDDYSAQISIFQFSDIADDEDDPLPDYKITLHNAYPIFINPQPMTWADNLFQKVIVNFTYTHWTRDKDPKPTLYGLVEGKEGGEVGDRDPTIRRPDLL